MITFKELDQSLTDKNVVRSALNSEWYLPGLYKSLGYVRGFVVSNVIFQMLEMGIFDDLNEGKSHTQIAMERSYDIQLLTAIFEFLVVEEVLEKEVSPQSGLNFKLSDYGSRMKVYAGWFNILVGGYGTVCSGLKTMLENGTHAVKRNGKWVGIGSCQISKFDTIPKTKEFIYRVKPDTKHILDFGCGNALYLCTLVQELEGIHATGIEPDEEAYKAGLGQVKALDLSHKIRLVNVKALDYEIEETPDVILFGFVLHEIVSQIGREQLIEYLSQFCKKFSESYLFVMEVDYDIDNHDIMKSKMGLGYYNPYYLIHPFTNQKLLPKEDWRKIFKEAGYEIITEEATSSKADPTGLGICYILKPSNAD